MGSAIDSVFGSSNDAGLTGTGQYHVDQGKVDSEQNKLTQDQGQGQVVSQEENQLNNIQGRQAPQAQVVNAQAAQVNQGMYDSDRDQQLGLTKQLQAQANGQGPSLATQQLQAGNQQNIQGQMAMLASQRGAGTNAALGMRQAADQAAAGSQNVAQQSAMDRITEQNNARQQLAGQLGTMANQDIGIAGQNATLQQQAALQNAQLGTQVNQGNAQNVLANNQEMDQASLGLDNSQLNAAQLNEQDAQAAGQLGLGYAQGNQQGQAAAGQSRGGIVGGLLGGAASALGSLSDENEKDSIQPASGTMINNFLQSNGTGGGGGGFGGSDVSNTNPKDAPKAGGGDTFSPATYGIDASNPTGEAALAARDAHTANFKQMGQGMGDWFNVSNAQPWSPESDAAKVNIDRFMGMDTGHAGVDQNPNVKRITISDENEKENVKDADTEALHRFLDSLNAHQYQYKNPDKPGAGEGKFISPMAQEFEATPVGKDLVREMPDGSKGVAYADPHALGALFAAQADAHKRLTALEGKKGGKKGKK